MALPITDYTAFFAGAKQAVQELEQLRERELCLEESEKTLEDQLRTREKAVADTIARTVKARGEEIARSYDTEDVYKRQGLYFLMSFRASPYPFRTRKGSEKFLRSK